MKYRKKPVVVDAFQWQPGMALPQWAVNGKCKEWNPEGTVIKLSVKTLEGRMAANPGDWIICGVKGECYPCKPDIFEMTYDAFDTDPDLCDRHGNQMIWPTDEEDCD